MVMVFDQHGQQVTDLQGSFVDVRDAVLAAADEQTEFHGWSAPLSWRTHADAEAIYHDNFHGTAACGAKGGEIAGPGEHATCGACAEAIERISADGP